MVVVSNDGGYVGGGSNTRERTRGIVIYRYLRNFMRAGLQ